MNKKSFVTALFLTFGIIGFAQDYKENIKTEFYEYFDLVSQKKFNESFEYLTPEFFDFVPKDEMKEMLEQTFNDPNVDLEFKNIKVLKVEDAEEIDGKYYSLLIYSNQMNYRSKIIENESEEKKKTIIETMQASFAEIFGAKNVKYDVESGFFEIQSEKLVYAISTDKKLNWKFLQVEKNMKVLLEQILPRELVDKV